MSHSKRTPVLIADDHIVFREGLRALFQNEKDLFVMGEADSGEEAVILCTELKPAIVIMDLAMPKLDGFEATRQIGEHAPESKVIVLSAYCSADYLERSRKAGAVGFLSKEHSYFLLIKAVREVLKGNTFFHFDGVEMVKPTKAKKCALKTIPALSPSLGLTARELQVLRLVAEGAANKQVAAQLGISIKTVEKHRQQLMNKLDIHDTAGLTRYAIASGVIDNDIPKNKSFST